MEPGYYKIIGSEVFYGTKIDSANYRLDKSTKDKPPVDGWVWYDNPPVAEVTMPCGCIVKMLIDPKTETEETVQAAVDVMAAKVIEGAAQKVSTSSVAVEPIVAEEAAVIG
jgi:hypothetical protein